MSHNSLDELIKIFAKLPGLGPRSARRIVLHMIKHQQNVLAPIIETTSRVANEIKICGTCGNVDIISPCSICCDPKRDKNLLCIVEDIADLWAFERGQFFKGVYHILGGTISALEGRTPDKLNIAALKERVANSNISEVIIATNPSLDGQTTGFYITDLLKPYNVRFSRLAHGIPLGAELDYMDEGTLSLALNMRQDF